MGQMFMEHEGGLFLFAEQTIVLQTVVPMCMIIMGILVNIKCVVIFACSSGVAYPVPGTRLWQLWQIENILILGPS